MKRLIVILSILVLAVGCREPRSLERFVKGEGPYRFIVDMSDTSAVYDFDFYTRIDIHGADIPTQAAIDVCWISPSGEELAETVYLPLAREVYAPYRAGLTPSEPGVWILIVTFPDPPKGLTGLGLVSRKVPIAEQSQLTGYLPPAEYPAAGCPTFGCPTFGCPTFECPTFECPTFGCPTVESPTAEKKLFFVRLPKKPIFLSAIAKPTHMKFE